MAMLGLWELEYELLRMQERTVMKYFYIFPRKITNSSDFLAFPESEGFIWLALWSREAGNFLVAQ
jgi:hypothetical protein